MAGCVSRERDVLSTGPDPLIDVEGLLRLCRQGPSAPLLIGMVPAWRFALHHIPGSRQVWRPQISQPHSSHLIGAAGFERWARRLGIGAHTRVVIWDERYDATRLWWAFHHYGKADVQVLDGGLQAWRSAGLPVARGWPRAEGGHGDFIALPAAGLPLANATQVLNSRNNPAIQLWDTREFAEWSGRRRLRGARRAGRIPWAGHLNWRLFRHGTAHNTRFRCREDLQEVIARQGLDRGKQQLFYCQSGVRTTTAIFALYRLGWETRQLVNYDGSWSEWSRDPRHPMQRDAWPPLRWFSRVRLLLLRFSSCSSSTRQD